VSLFVYILQSEYNVEPSLGVAGGKGLPQRLAVLGRRATSKLLRAGMSSRTVRCESLHIGVVSDHQVYTRFQQPVLQFLCRMQIHDYNGVLKIARGFQKFTPSLDR
jgi:hypothetical protein